MHKNLVTGDSSDGLYQYTGAISEVMCADVSDKEEFTRVATDQARRLIADLFAEQLILTDIVVNEQVGTFTASYKTNEKEAEIMQEQIAIPYLMLDQVGIQLTAMQRDIERFNENLTWLLPILDDLSDSKEGEQALQEEAATVARLIADREAELCKNK